MGDGEGTKTALTSTPSVDKKTPQPYLQSFRDEKTSERSPQNRGWVQKVIDAVSYVPPRCRYDPEKPFLFSMGLNVLFGMLDESSLRQAVN